MPETEDPAVRQAAIRVQEESSIPTSFTTALRLVRRATHPFITWDQAADAAIAREV